MSTSVLPKNICQKNNCQAVFSPQPCGLTFPNPGCYQDHGVAMFRLPDSLPVHLDVAYVELRDRQAIPFSPADQQRDQSRNENQRKNRYGEAWSGKIDHSGQQRRTSVGTISPVLIQVSVMSEEGGGDIGFTNAKDKLYVSQKSENLMRFLAHPVNSGTFESTCLRKRCISCVSPAYFFNAPSFHVW